MSEILVNDIFDELREENDRLSKQLCFEIKLNEILENIKTYSLIVKNNCICSENIEIFKKLNDFEIDYKVLKSKQKQFNCKEKSHLFEELAQNGINCDTKPNTSGILISNVKSTKRSEELAITENNCSKEESDFDPRSKTKSKSITDYLRSYRRPNPSVITPESTPIQRITKSDGHMRLITEMLKPRRDSEPKDKSTQIISSNDIKTETKCHNSSQIQCPEFGCQLILNTGDELEKHIRDSHPSLVCSKCSQLFYSTEEVFTHLSAVHKVQPQNYWCSSCDYKTPFKYSYERHQKNRVCAKGNFKCSNVGCNASFGKASMLTQHKIKCDENMKNGLKAEDTLTSCPKAVKVNESLVCPLCPFKTKSVNHMKKHQNCHSSDRPFRCDINGCTLAYNRKTHLQEHQKRGHKTTVSQISLLKELTQSLRNASKLDFSLNSENNLVEDQNEELIVSGLLEESDIKLEFISDSDNESSIMKNKNEMSKVMNNGLNSGDKQKSSEPKFSCNSCEFKTNTKFVLTVHQTKEHPEMRPHKCDFPKCGKAYSRADTLNKHKRLSHKGHKKESKGNMPSLKLIKSSDSFECNICGYKTEHLQHMRRHMANHSPVKAYKCEFEGCNYSAHRKDNLSKHRKRHHNKTPNYICNYPNCNRGFESSLVLKQHMNSHKNRFVCRWEGCQHRTDTFAKLNEHRRNENHMPPQLL